MWYSLPYLPWQHDTDWIISIFYCTTQGGQGKYNSDCWVSLPLALSHKNFANGNMALDTKAWNRHSILFWQRIIYKQIKVL
jgi:hypothetical protein